jgi:putative membrane protein
MNTSPVLTRGTFDPKLKTYIVLYGALSLIVSIAGIVLLPIWPFLGRWYARKTLAHLECVLTERALIVKKGFLIRHERTIPLDKIQDVALKEGPLLRRLGLSTLRVETAGQSSQPGAEVNLTGIVDVHDFRDRVLMQRD